MKKNGTTSVVPLPSCSLGSRSTQHCEAERNSAPFLVRANYCGNWSRCLYAAGSYTLGAAGRLHRLTL
jgi:hypothetical protein